MILFLIGLLNFSDMRYVVFDEADTLMDENFRSLTTDFLKLIDVMHCFISRNHFHIFFI